MPINPLNEKFDLLVKETLELWHSPSVSIAVIDGDQIWTKSYGIVSFPSTPSTPSTLYHTGSTTKAFTAAILSMIVDDNDKYPSIRWDTPICELLRADFVLENEYATTHTTLEDALSHRSGLPAHDRAYGGPKTSITDIVRSLRYLPLTAEPRTKYQYCNTMFVVASAVIEQVTGQKLGDLMRAWIWAPLEMNSTFSTLSAAKKAVPDLDLAKPYRYNELGKLYEELAYMDLSAISGAGFIISSVQDYAKWARALMASPASPPLSKPRLEAILTPRTLMPTEEPFMSQAYALGWETGVYKGEKYFGHSGNLTGFGAEFKLFPDQKFAVVALANAAGTAGFVGEKLAFHLVDEKLGIPEEKRFDWNGKNQNLIREGKHKSLNATQILYPSLPSPPLPPTLPLSSYTGTYHHPAYQTLIIYLSPAQADEPPQLRADRTSTNWTENLTFAHISGEFFIARSEHVWGFGTLYDDCQKVEFRLRVDGSVGEVGVGWEKAMDGEEKIWLRRKEKE